VVVGSDIIVTVFGINGGQIRLGIDAPRDVPVHRQEIYLRICEERKALEGHEHQPSSTFATQSAMTAGAEVKDSIPAPAGPAKPAGKHPLLQLAVPARKQGR